MDHQEIKKAFANQKPQYLNAKAVSEVQDGERRYRLFMSPTKSRDKYIDSELKRIDKIKDADTKSLELEELYNAASYGSVTMSIEKARKDLLDTITDKQISFRQIAKQYNCDFTIFSAKKNDDDEHGRMPSISVLCRLGYDKSVIDKSANEILLGEKIPVTLPHKLDFAVAYFEQLAKENNVVSVDVMRRQHITPLYDIYTATREEFVSSNKKRNDAIAEIIQDFATKSAKAQGDDTEQAIREIKNSVSDPINTKVLLDERINEFRENGFREYNNPAPSKVSMRTKIRFRSIEESDYSTRGIRNTTFMLLRIETGQPIDYFAAEDYTQQCDLQYTDSEGKSQLVKSDITKRLIGFWLGMHPDDQDKIIIEWNRHAMRYLLKK